MSDREEFAKLARGLRARTEVFDENDWFISAAPAKRRIPLVQRNNQSSAADSSRAGDVAEQLAALEKQVAACRKCPLGSQRLNVVFGVGSPRARVMFIGEGPGFEEDHKGEPFVGKSGQLLDRILASIGLSRRDNAYIANIVKCHPMIDPSDPERRANDRPPGPEEIAACRCYLDEQIRLISPRVLVTLGAVALRVLLGTTAGITKIRGTWLEYQGIPLLPTYHPAALLRNPDLKRDVWTDMKNLKTRLSQIHEEN